MNHTQIFEKVIAGIVRKNLCLKPTERYLFFTDSNSVFEENFETMVERREFLHAFQSNHDHRQLLPGDTLVFHKPDDFEVDLPYVRARTFVVQ